ncbi:hypothetical protein OH805_18950 [Streptomyces sp. NBC_00879]|uniref:hypothetical protein n=1 Tax=Streptomyces sp. NBC_00879 TaxID=2975855 RepID=UPI003863E8F3|nr:hypothetical protein OH805_18950 [Streptomyces sp. NBC_00879]
MPLHPSTLRTLKRAAELTRQNHFVEAVLLAEPVILSADEQEAAEIRRWLIEHTAQFTKEGTHSCLHSRASDA